MPKMKTYQALAKRITITKCRKILKRSSGQDHFNSRESGAATRNKRRDEILKPAIARNVKRLIPYS